MDSHSDLNLRFLFVCHAQSKDLEYNVGQFHLHRDLHMATRYWVSNGYERQCRGVVFTGSIVTTNPFGRSNSAIASR